MQKRKDRRFRQWNRTTITLLESGQGLRAAPEIEAFTYDISLGGARVHSPEPFTEGAVLRLHIVLARTRDSITLDGQVKWSREHETENVYEIGVEFIHEKPQAFMSLMKNLYDAGIVRPSAAADPPWINRSDSI